MLVVCSYIETGELPLDLSKRDNRLINEAKPVLDGEDDEGKVTSAR